MGETPGAKRARERRSMVGSPTHWKVVWTGGSGRGDEAQRDSTRPQEERVHTALCFSLTEARTKASLVGPGARIVECYSSGRMATVARAQAS